MGFNALASLPDSLSGCQELRTLDVRFVSLEILFCRAMLYLNTSLSPMIDLCRNNRLKEVCPGICSLKLSLLDLTNNDLRLVQMFVYRRKVVEQCSLFFRRTLPPQLGLMSSLRSMPLDGNPLKLIRRELVAGSISNLLKFLVSRLPEDSAPAALARSGNVWAADEAQLAADMARKITVASEAETTSSAAAGAPLPGGYAAIHGRGQGVGWQQGGPVPASVPASSGRELSLRGAGLTDLPAEVWQAAAHLTKLDVSCNK